MTEDPYAALRETHTSVVLLVGDRAYKIKKPVRLPFVDLSTRERRRHNCDEELRLNRRLAPDVYLGVQELGDGDLPAGSGEPVVVMRRMPEARRLSAILAAGGAAEACVREVARQVATMHAAEEPVWDYRLARTMGSLWDEGHDQMRPFAGEVVDGALLDQVHALATEYLRGRSGLLDRRERGGLVRDGHGDLLTDDIFCLDDGPRILDCLEFDRRLRLGDVLADLAFLAMDLELHGAPELARLLVDRYRHLDAETHPRTLEHHYVAYRAFVRSKVECLRLHQGDPDSAGRARTLLDLTDRHLRVGRVHLVLVGGLPGSGKSTLAQAITDADPGREWAAISTDVVRKELAGVDPMHACAAAYGQGIYDAGHTEAAYAEALRRAGIALRSGVNVLLDASWTDPAERARARACADARAAALTELRCEASEEVCLRRLAERQGPRASDADADIHRAMGARAAGWPEAVSVRTDGDASGAATLALELLAQRGVVTPAAAGETGDPRHAGD
ncbi:MAG: AAA family ATPase [Kineosporiaceae bacterium]